MKFSKFAALGVTVLAIGLGAGTNAQAENTTQIDPAVKNVLNTYANSMSLNGFYRSMFDKMDTIAIKQDKCAAEAEQTRQDYREYLQVGQAELGNEKTPEDMMAKAQDLPSIQASILKIRASANNMGTCLGRTPPKM